MVIEPILTRRSTRKFTDTPVTKAQAEALLTAAMLSPSACNTRPWRFIAITNREMLTKIADNHPWAGMLHTAQMAIAVIALPQAQEDVQNGLPLGFYPQDCAAAVQSILIQAEAIGLGTCWCGVYPREKTINDMAAVLETAPEEIPFAIIAIGEKDQYPNPRGQYEEAKVTWLE